MSGPYTYGTDHHGERPARAGRCAAPCAPRAAARCPWSSTCPASGTPLPIEEVTNPGSPGGSSAIHGTVTFSNWGENDEPRRRRRTSVSLLKLRAAASTLGARPRTDGGADPVAPRARSRPGRHHGRAGRRGRQRGQPPAARRRWRRRRHPPRRRRRAPAGGLPRHRRVPARAGRGHRRASTCRPASSSTPWARSGAAAPRASPRRSPSCYRNALARRRRGGRPLRRLPGHLDRCVRLSRRSGRRDRRDNRPRGGHRRVPRPIRRLRRRDARRATSSCSADRADVRAAGVGRGAATSGRRRSRRRPSRR